MFFLFVWLVGFFGFFLENVGKVDVLWAWETNKTIFRMCKAEAQRPVLSLEKFYCLLKNAGVH